MKDTRTARFNVRSGLHLRDRNYTRISSYLFIRSVCSTEDMASTARREGVPKGCW